MVLMEGKKWEEGEELRRRFWWEGPKRRIEMYKVLEGGGEYGVVTFNSKDLNAN